jgi:hypothetical protein
MDTLVSLGLGTAVSTIKQGYSIGEASYSKESISLAKATDSGESKIKKIGGQSTIEVF